MEIKNYNIEHDIYNDVVNIEAITEKGIEFNYSFADSYTLKEVQEKLQELADELDGDN